MPSTWEAALAALKPGGHLLAFGGPRTYHRLATAVEDAGFEVRDQIMWVYAQGFPKSRDCGEGRGTQLKPAHEPIVVARKPFEGSVFDNVGEHGTGAYNIDASRIPYVSDADLAEAARKNPGTDELAGGFYEGEGLPQQQFDEKGRWPANFIIDQEISAVLDAQSGIRRGGGYPEQRGGQLVYDSRTSGGSDGPRSMGDTGGASRFFFCPKVGRLERDLGLEDFEAQMLRWSSGEQSPGTFQSDGTDRFARNPHPTVKPIELMRWLVGLVTPPGGTVMDPFTGSGSTGIAAVLDCLNFLGFEKKGEYAEIARARIERWSQHAGYKLQTEDILRSAAAERVAKEAGQVGLFDQ
jgi:DNA methylase